MSELRELERQHTRGITIAVLRDIETYQSKRGSHVENKKFALWGKGNWNGWAYQET